MTAEQHTVILIKCSIESLPAESQESIKEIAECIRRIVKNAPDGEGAMALVLVGAELASE